MSTSKFQTARCEALRKQLLELPTVAGTEVAAKASLSDKATSLANPQQNADRLSPGASSHLESLGIDSTQTRLLGRSDSYTSFGAPAAEVDSMPGTPSGNKICIISVPADGQRASVGCTLLKSFEGAGLKVESPDRTEAAWLLVPAGTKEALNSVSSEDG